MANDRGFEDLIRQYMGDEAADLFRDIVVEASRASVSDRVRKLSDAIGDALDSLQRASELTEEISDLLED